MRHAGYAMSRHVRAQPRAKVCMPLCNKTTVCLVTQLGVPKKKKQEHRDYYACCLTIVGARKSVDKHRGTSIRCVDMLIWQALLSSRTCRVIIVMQLIGDDWLVSQGGPQVAIHRKEVGVKVSCERQEDVSGV